MLDTRLTTRVRILLRNQSNLKTHHILLYLHAFSYNMRNTKKYAIVTPNILMQKDVQHH